MSYKYVKSFRQRLKDRCVYVSGGCCQICGYNTTNAALDFHHLDPSKKDFTLSSNTNCSWEAARKEIEKTILVCSNCHREIHAGIIDNNMLHSGFDEEKAKEIDALVLDVKTKKIVYCRNCGKEISSKAVFCKQCGAEKRRVAERPDRETLKQLIRNNPMVQVGKMYNVSDNSIRKWCKSFNLPSKKQEINKYTDVEWETI